MLIGASGPSVRGLGVRGEERMQKMRVSLEDEVLLEADLGHYRHEHSVWSNMSIKVEGSDASPACTGMDSCAAESASFEHGAAAVLSVWHERKSLASQLPLYDYAPDVHWQFALGARAHNPNPNPNPNPNRNPNPNPNPNLTLTLTRRLHRRAR